MVVELFYNKKGDMFLFSTALLDLSKTALSGPPKGVLAKSISSSINGSVTTNEGGDNKDSSTDGSSSKWKKRVDVFK
jgi:hypothetical protein